MKKKDIASAVIDRVDYPNKGRFHVPETGEEGVVKNVIPGQEVLFRVYKKHGNTVYGNRLDVVKKSPLETREPVCANFGKCGGCLYQTLPYENQLEMKAEQIRKLLAPVLPEDAVFDGMLPSPKEFGYRNKLDLSFGDEVMGGPLTCGMHRTGTRYTVLDADTCRLASADLTKISAHIRDYCAECCLPPYNKLKHEGYLRYLLLRRSETTGEILICLAVSSQMKHDFGPLVRELLDLALEESAIAGIHLAICDRYADALLPDSMTCLYGRDYFYEELLGLKFKVTLFSFFQTNTRGAEVLYERVRAYVREGWAEETGIKANARDGREGERRTGPDVRDRKLPVLFDLYCGTGTIAQIMAPECSRVFGIEIVEEAVEAAKKNAALNGLANCSFLAGDVPQLLPSLPEKPDYVILDPPREGVHEKALSMISGYGIKSLVYVSCKASSLLRDLIYMRKDGWQVKRWSLCDLFPETQHCETICLLARAPATDI